MPTRVRRAIEAGQGSAPASRELTVSRSFAAFVRCRPWLLVVPALVAFLLAAPVLAADADATFHTAKGEFTFHLEFADTPAAQEKGLMFRKSLAPDAGMLFDFHDEEVVAFWMKNTLIPLDMLFIGA